MTRKTAEMTHLKLMEIKDLISSCAIISRQVFWKPDVMTKHSSNHCIAQHLLSDGFSFQLGFVGIGWGGGEAHGDVVRAPKKHSVDNDFVGRLLLVFFFHFRELNGS
jgi:hypothetical protein